MEDIINRYKGKKEEVPVPEGYFDALPDQVLGRIAEEDAQMQALLAAHRSNDGYPVPEGYFSQLPDAVMAKAAAEPARKLFLQRRWVRVASVAACAGLLIGTGIYVFNSFQDFDQQSEGKVARENCVPPVPADTRSQTLNLDEALAQVSDVPEMPVEKRAAAAPAAPSTDAATDQFIEENLDESDLDEVDFEILDFYSDDMSVSDMWGF